MRIFRFLRDITKPHMRRVGKNKEDDIPMYKKPQGVTLKDLREHYSLQPLFIIIGCGVAIVTGYCYRLATQNLDVKWKKDGALSNDDYRSKQSKFFNPSGIDYSKQGTEIPDYKKDDEDEDE